MVSRISIRGRPCPGSCSSPRLLLRSLAVLHRRVAEPGRGAAPAVTADRAAAWTAVPAPEAAGRTAAAWAPVGRMGVPAREAAGRTGAPARAVAAAQAGAAVAGPSAPP